MEFYAILACYFLVIPLVEGTALAFFRKEKRWMSMAVLVSVGGLWTVLLSFTDTFGPSAPYQGDLTRLCVELMIFVWLRLLAFYCLAGVQFFDRYGWILLVLVPVANAIWFIAGVNVAMVFGYSP